MSLFIHCENQTLLWETLHKSPYWQPFKQSIGENAQLWFRNIISLFYDRRWETHPDLHMTVQELKQLNREVILYCVQDIKRCLGVDISPKQTLSTVSVSTSASASGEDLASAFDMSSRLAMYDRPPAGGGATTPLPTTASTSTPTTVSIPTYAQLQSEYNVSEQRETLAKHAAKQFEDFQRQYNDNFTETKPNAIDFNISLNEPKIKNMEELMEQQMKYREMEDKRYTPALNGGI